MGAFLPGFLHFLQAILIMDGGVNTEIERKGVSMRKMSRIVARRRQAIVRISEKLSDVQRKTKTPAGYEVFRRDRRSEFDLAVALASRGDKIRRLTA